MAKSTPMTSKAAARIQSATAIKNSGNTPKGSFSTRAQSTVANDTTSSKGAKK